MQLIGFCYWLTCSCTDDVRTFDNLFKHAQKILEQHDDGNCRRLMEDVTLKMPIMNNDLKNKIDMYVK